MYELEGASLLQHYTLLVNYVGNIHQLESRIQEFKVHSELSVQQFISFVKFGIYIKVTTEPLLPDHLYQFQIHSAHLLHYFKGTYLMPLI